MQLPNLPFLEKKEESQHFLSLIFRSDRIEAFIFEKIGDEMRVVSSQQENFEDSLDNAKYEEILEITDRVISQGEDEANIKGEIEKTIFGLKESWVEDNKIKRENLDILKKLCEELALKPIGFLTISEAVVGLLQKEEGAPPSAILADVAKNNLTISLVRGGKVIEVKSSEIHQSAAFTVDTLLKHFTNIEILPSRVVLLNEDEDLVQEFIGHQWSKSLPFLHLPQISNLPSGSLGKAFILGIAKQVGAKVMDEFETAQGESFSAKTPEEQAEQEQIENPEVKPTAVEPKSNIEYISDNAQEFFGFVQGKDVGKIKPPEPEVIIPSAQEEVVTEELPEEIKIETEGKQILPAAIMQIAPKVKESLGLIFGKIKNLNIKLPSNMPSLPFGKGPTVFLFFGGLFIILIFIFYFALLKADVQITVKPNVVEKTEDITFSTSASDFKNNVIKGNLITVSEDGTVTGDATGKKQTGDKAKGTVTVFNQLSTTQTISKGAIIKSSNGLIFNLDSDLTIAGVASHSADQTVAPVTKLVNVTASDFGKEYNLPSGTKFSVTNYSTGDLVAKNDNPFSGGTTKDIIVFSKDDAQKLRDDLIKSLEEKAKSDMQNKLQASEALVSSFVDETLDKENFDKDVDQEAKTVTLKGTATYEGLSYDKNEFINYLKSVLGQNINIDIKNVELSFENIKSKNNEITTTLKTKAKIFPKLDTTGLLKNISGKSFQEAQNQILSLPDVESVKINFSPNLFFFPEILPRIQKNIIFQILENG